MNAQGALYLSATWAKRPDNIPLYFLTAIRHAVNNIADLPAIMQQGGLPMQTHCIVDAGTGRAVIPP